jgi:two-component system sensor histidine kinase DesK
MTNDGIRSPRSADGSGIAGLRARAAAVGGTVSVVVRADEFVLRVTVPATEGDT